LKKAEKEMKSLNLTQDGMKAVLSSIQLQLQAHESRISMTEGDCTRLGSELNQSVENVKGLTNRLNDLGLRQDDLQGVVSVLKSQVGSHEEKLEFNKREIEEWSQHLKITNDEAKKLTESLEKMELRVDEVGKNSLLEELRDRVVSNERAIGEMLHLVGIQDLEIDSLTKQMQEDGVTRGELLELVPVVNTLKTVIENQVPPPYASTTAVNQRSKISCLGSTTTTAAASRCNRSNSFEDFVRGDLSKSCDPIAN
jgi:chromosome segregation ATPase